MGVNAEAWVPRNLDLESVQQLPTLLNAACPGRDVWIWDETDSRRTKAWSWDVLPSEESIAAGLCAIDGPGLKIHVRAHVMIVWSLARWRGFLQYRDLRTRVREATTRVMRVLRTTHAIWLPDWASDDILPKHDTLTIESMRNHLLAEWGQPQHSVESITAELLREAKGSSPKVWFEESIG